MDLNTRLSADFTLGELVRSETAERDPVALEQQENPPTEVVNNLRYLAETVLQPIRSRLAFPLTISSGYRSPKVNELVGGSATSQHCRGEAADCQLSTRFLTDPATEEIRREIQERVGRMTGRSLRSGVTANAYLFAYLCTHLDEFDVDQLIHEYGTGFGQPAWVHVSASTRQDKRQVMMIGRYTDGRYLTLTPEEALRRCSD